MLRRSKTESNGDPIPIADARVLIVDNDADAAELVATLLSHLEFRTERCDDIDASIGLLTAAKAEDDPFALVLADLRQGGTGASLKLLDLIRAHTDRDIAQTRVVICTDVDENRIFSWQSGADGFLIRPIPAVELIDTIAGALGRDSDERIAHRQSQIESGSGGDSLQASGS